MEPEIRYVHSFDGTRLATASARAGPPLLMTTSMGLGSIEEAFGVAEWSDSIEAISERFRFVTYDPRGQGLSDRDDSDLSLEARVGDLVAVADGLGLPPLNLLARGVTGPTAIAYAARNPERISHLVLWAATARARDLRAPARGLAIAPLIDVDWALYCEVRALIDHGWTDTGRHAAAFRERSITPQTFSKNLVDLQEHDATDCLQDVRCPTLVVYPKSFEGRLTREVMQDIAARIPNATFRTSERYSLYWGGADIDIEVVTDFCADGAAGSTSTPSGTSIILFADIADSTALTERMGDVAFRRTARELDGALRAAVTEQGGVVIDAKTLGDGILATFPSAAQGVAAALVCGATGDARGLPLHLGLHAGDVIREANNVFGGAVNIAARISALSAPGEILVSATVRDLARTSAGVTFADRGEQRLKGVADPVRVFAVGEGGD